MAQHRFLCLVLLVTLGACTNMSTFQTGRTVGAQRFRFGAAVSAAIINDFDVVTGVNDEEDTDLTKGVPIPSLELWARYGLTDTIDLGLRIYTLGLSGEFKTQFVGDQRSPFALSVGMVINWFGINAPADREDDPMTMEDESVDYGGAITLLDVSSVMYVSYTFADEWVNLYLSPRYISRTLILGATVNDRSAQVGLGLDLVGSGFGVGLGRDFTFYVEGGLYTPIGFKGLVTGLGLGFDF